MSTSVDVDFFDAFGAEIVAGRGFNSGDLESDPGSVVVNEHFVTEILQGRNAIGRRVRYATRVGQRGATGRPRGLLPRARLLEPGPWYEIVGVVNDPGMDTSLDPFWPGWGPGVYHPVTRDAMGSGGSYSVRMAFHVRANAVSFGPELREIAHSVHPGLRLYDVLPMDRPVDSANQAQSVLSRFLASVTGLVGLIALLISTAGVYSVMSFTVSRQTREIGIRIALGAHWHRVITGVFSRAMVQIGIGILVGVLLWFYVLVYQLGGGNQIGLLLTAAVVLMLVALVACGVPVSRALRIQPAEALKDVG